MPIAARDPSSRWLVLLERGRRRRSRAIETAGAEALMKKMMVFIGTTIGGYAGWYLGNLVGFMTAFALSMVGTGVGMYLAIKTARNYE
jgi:hypothetical protein